MNIKKFFKIVFSFVFTFCMFGAVAFGALYIINPELFNTQNLLGSILNPLSAPQKPINILLMGADKVGMNTDVMLVANINPVTKEIHVVSIPRDTKIQYKGTHKINSMYGRGKAELAKEKVSEIIGNPIDYAVITKPEGFRNIIDILGGVEVDVPGDMNYDDYDQDLHIHLKKGLQTLNGDKAEEFVRYRHGYAEGDLGRIEAQKIFFKAFVEQKLKPEYILKADKILGQIFENVKTDIPLDIAIKYALAAKDMPSQNISFLNLPGNPKKTNGVWYFIHDSVEIEKQLRGEFSLEATPKASSAKQ
ncbi:MAG: LCP family protein [Deltaproteobacteria bacterium]